VYRAENVTTTTTKQFQVHLNRGRHAATIWSDANRQSAKSSWNMKYIKWHLLKTWSSINYANSTSVVLATGPVLDLASFIGLRGNGLTPSKIDDILSEPSL
jgi:hypothetical protein